MGEKRDERHLTGETLMGMPVFAYYRNPEEHKHEWALHWSTIPRALNPIKLFKEADVRERLEKLEAALREIAAQKTCDEMTLAEMDAAAFSDGYDMCILTARKALEDNT